MNRKTEARYKRFSTVKELSSFQVTIFHPDSCAIKVAPYLWGCDLCLPSEHGSCELFSECTLQTRILNKISLCHQYQEYSVDYDIQESLEIGDLVSNNQIVVIAAKNSSINTVWFVHKIGIKCVDHLSNNIDDYGHNVPKSQLYLLYNYLEKLNDNKEGVSYEKSF